MIRPPRPSDVKAIVATSPPSLETPTWVLKTPHREKGVSLTWSINLSSGQEKLSVPNFPGVISRISLQATASRKAATLTRPAQEFPVNTPCGGHSQRFESAAGTARSPPGPTQPQRAESPCPHPPSCRAQTTLFSPESVRERYTPGPVSQVTLLVTTSPLKASALPGIGATALKTHAALTKSLTFRGYGSPEVALYVRHSCQGLLVGKEIQTSPCWASRVDVGFLGNCQDQLMRPSLMSERSYARSRSPYSAAPKVCPPKEEPSGTRGIPQTRQPFQIASRPRGISNPWVRE